MKYWKFKSRVYSQFFLLTKDQQLLFGNYSERKINDFINSIELTGIVPEALSGISLSNIKSVEKGHRNKSIKFTLNNDRTELIEFNKFEDRDDVYMGLKLKLEDFTKAELDLSKSIKKQFFYNSLKILVLVVLIWWSSDVLTGYGGIGGMWANGALVGAALNLLVKLTGNLGIIAIGSVLIFYQFFRLRQRLIQDSKIEILKKVWR